jgi:hypothetical protein
MHFLAFKRANLSLAHASQNIEYEIEKVTKSKGNLRGEIENEMPE